VRTGDASRSELTFADLLSAAQVRTILVLIMLGGTPDSTPVRSFSVSQRNPAAGPSTCRNDWDYRHHSHLRITRSGRSKLTVLEGRCVGEIKRISLFALDRYGRSTGHRTAEAGQQI
jgi:hypothetical protein